MEKDKIFICYEKDLDIMERIIKKIEYIGYLEPIFISDIFGKGNQIKTLCDCRMVLVPDLDCDMRIFALKLLEVARWLDIPIIKNQHLDEMMSNKLITDMWND